MQFHNTPIPKKQKSEDDDSFQEKEKGKVSNEKRKKKRSYGRNPNKPIHPSPLRRSNRNKKRKNAANEIVTIESSDENEDDLIDTDEDLVDDNDIEVNNQFYVDFLGCEWLTSNPFFLSIRSRTSKLNKQYRTH